MAQSKWVVVADGSRARVFQTDDEAQNLAEIADLANPEGRSNDGELASYASGEGRPGARTATQDKSASDHSIDVFSKSVARYLDGARKERRFDSVYLIAGPDFLGRLRQDLSQEVRKLVADDLDKDVSWFNARDLEKYVKKVIAPGNAQAR